MGLTLMRVRENLEVCSFHARNGLAAIHGLEVKIRKLFFRVAVPANVLQPFGFLV